jgi:acetolactate synthase-1/2/3 large subunit
VSALDPERLARRLAGAGIRIVAGVERGGSGLPLAAACARHRVTFVSAATAGSAVVIAAVAADLSDTPAAVVLGQPDSGHEALGALRHARRGGSPLIVIGASADDVTSVLRAVVKARCREPADAARVAMSPPRGPVHLVLDAADELVGEPVEHGHAAPAAPLDRRLLSEVATRLGACARPVVVAGACARGAADAQWLRAFAESLPGPVLTTAKARGVLPEPHPLSLGPLGGEVAGTALARADLLVLLGVDAAELDDAGSPWTAPVIAIGGSAAFADGTAGLRVPGPVARVLEELAPRIRDRARADWDMVELDAMKRRLAAAREGEGDAMPAGRECDDARGRCQRSVDMAGRARRIVGLVREATPAGAVAVFDAGWRGASLAWQCVTPGDVVVGAGGPGMALGIPPSLARATPPGGFAVPAALGARAVRPDSTVVCFTDAAGIAESARDLAAARGRPVAVVVLEHLDASLASMLASVGCRVVRAHEPAVIAERVAAAADGAGPLVIDAG